MTSQVHPQQFGPLPAEHAARVEHDLSNFEALSLIENAATHQSELKPLSIVTDVFMRNDYRAIATPFELDNSRILKLYGGGSAFRLSPAGRINLPLTAPATPIVNSEGMVVGYVGIKLSSDTSWSYFLKPDGEMLHGHTIAEGPLEDSIFNDIVVILATAGAGAYIRALTRLSAAAIAAGGMRAVLSRFGAGVAAGAAIVVRAAAGAAFRRLAQTSVGKAILGRILSKAEEKAIRDSWANFLGKDWVGKAIRFNLGGEGEKPGFIDVNDFRGSRMTADAVAKRNPTGKLLQASVEDMSMVPNDIADEIASQMFNPGPGQMDKIATKMASETRRILKPGNKARIDCTNAVFPEGSVARAEFQKLGFTFPSPKSAILIK